jgi:hypothetical protein
MRLSLCSPVLLGVQTVLTRCGVGAIEQRERLLQRPSIAYCGL